MNKKIGRNALCPCGSGKKFKKCCMKNRPSFSWMEDDGLHCMIPGETPSEELLDEMTEKYQKQIRNSPMWEEMVKEFGQKKAEELLKQCRAKLD